MLFRGGRACCLSSHDGDWGPCRGGRTIGRLVNRVANSICLPRILGKLCRAHGGRPTRRGRAREVVRGREFLSRRRHSVAGTGQWRGWTVTCRQKARRMRQTNCRTPRRPSCGHITAILLNCSTSRAARPASTSFSPLSPSCPLHRALNRWTRLQLTSACPPRRNNTSLLARNACRPIAPHPRASPLLHPRESHPGDLVATTMPGSETPGTDGSTLRERRPQLDGNGAAAPSDAAATVKGLNDEAKEKKTFGRTPDGTS